MNRTAPTSPSDTPPIAELAGGAIGIAAPGQRRPAADLDAWAAWNAAAVVTLLPPPGTDAPATAPLGAEVRRRHMEWFGWPMPADGAPDPAWEAAWPARSALLRGLLARGCRVLLHDAAGQGAAPTPAAATLAARLLADMVAAPACPDAGHDAARDRAAGALLGLAAGDAVGAAVEFTPRPRFALLHDMGEGGPHRLARGQWTDDTAMALALADSLLAAPALDPADLMRRFADWQDRGTYSCTGTCFDIGITVRRALDRFRRTGEPLAGSTAADASGNGALMRIAPVAIRHWRDPATMARVAAAQTRTTHGSPATLHASAVFTDLLAQAIAGASLSGLLASPAAAQVEGGWRGLPRSAVRGTGYVVDSLQAALWAVSRSTDFRSAVLLAANLGQDADTTAAIAGQLAGAVHGTAGIPPAWLQALAWRDRIEGTAHRLFDAGAPPA